MEGGWTYPQGAPSDLGVSRSIRIEKHFAKTFLQGCFSLAFLCAVLPVIIHFLISLPWKDRR